jgi:hypothetical protein
MPASQEVRLQRWISIRKGVVAAFCNAVFMLAKSASFWRLFIARFFGTAGADAPDMMDVIFIAATCGFFAVAITYVWGCTRL